MHGNATIEYLDLGKPLCRKLLAAGCEVAGRSGEGCFELSIGNPDKGLLPLELVRQRVQQFVQTGTPVVVTQASPPFFERFIVDQQRDALA